ncbi:maltokinase N-terminal cap-like domain-containing protein [Aquipuribacter sp. SD81]|uniref:maltokinase N-terminal cap-like domain-containing protein n=1 Tax=Aquipuribacter sp. SD81 TaxID=3127703 RepID=UPI00301B1AF9
MSAPDLDRPLEALLHRWMPAQRWYPAKGRGVGLRLLSRWELPAAGDGTVVEVLVVGLDSGDRVDVVQVPLVRREAPRDGAEHALVGELTDGDGPRWVYDGPHDPAFVSALLGSLDTPPGGPGVAPGPTSVLSGEQSNTSIIVRAEAGPPAIVKVFRTLHPGANPDVEVLDGLTRVGCEAVPALLGWSSGSWSLPSGDRAEGHLAVAVEFLAGSEDAWRVALAALRDGQPFDEQARGLGAAVAHVHLDLARAFGTEPVDTAARARSVETLRGRVRWAADAVEELAPLRERLDAHAASLDTALADLPDLQRVHGDLHLGQVLHSPARGWALLDFEGEPLRPLAERVLPDLALRDVAGVLRSLDYAAGHDGVTGAGTPGTDPEAWAQDARDAFCEGYGSVTGRDPRDDAALLRTLELDKALYEVVYEARNRPSWLRIPLQAVERLLP